MVSQPASPEPRPRRLKAALRLMLFGALALVATAIVALFLIVKLVLAPATGEWSTRAHVGPFAFELGVPTAIRLATSEWFAPQLAGHAFDTRFGTVRLGWNAADRTLDLHCAPCTATVAAFGAQPITVAQLRLSVRRDGNLMDGVLEAIPTAAAGLTDAQPPVATAATLTGASSATTAVADHADARLHARWTGRLTQKALQLDLDADPAPIAVWYAVLAPSLPELQQARISGSLALKVKLALPANHFTLEPQLAQFGVEGLGTEALLEARPRCGAPSRLTRDSWLARAVIAAEDQRFFQHEGYDLAELAASIDANQKSGQVSRGGSTLTQQLAKLLVTGGERTLERKLRELLYAVEMEQTLGKTRILQLYLDNVPWGAQVCGAESAARLYFQRSALSLAPAQAVWLAAMLHRPVAEVNRWKRDGAIDTVRAQWVAEGIRGISRRQREALLKSVATARFAPP